MTIMVVNPEAGGNASDQATESSTQQLGVLASRFAANTRRGKTGGRVDSGESSLGMPKLFKPDEPDFSHDPSS